MKYKERKTTCHCGNPVRPNNRLCKACHAAYQREYRAQVRECGIDHKGVYAALVKDAKRKILLSAIREERGDLTAAAIRLGVHRNTVNRIMRESGLSALDVKRYLKAVAA